MEPFKCILHIIHFPSAFHKQAGDYQNAPWSRGERLHFFQVNKQREKLTKLITVSTTCKLFL